MKLSQPIGIMPTLAPSKSSTRKALASPGAAPPPVDDVLGAADAEGVALALDIASVGVGVTMLPDGISVALGVMVTGELALGTAPEGCIVAAEEAIGAAEALGAALCVGMATDIEATTEGELGAVVIDPEPMAPASGEAGLLHDASAALAPRQPRRASDE